jgi:hypothetical protein
MSQGYINKKKIVDVGRFLVLISIDIFLQWGRGHTQARTVPNNG